MERKEGVKMEDVLGNSSFSDYIANSFSLQSIFDLSEGERIPLGFMELLGVQDLSPPLFDMAAEPVPSLAIQPPNPTSKKIESPEVFIQPATPNSSSISSASSEAVNDELVKVEDQEEDQQKNKKQ